MLDAVVVGTQLDLAWKVEQNVGIVAKFLEPLLKPIKIFLEILHAIQHSTIRTQTKLVHYRLEGDQR